MGEESFQSLVFDWIDRASENFLTHHPWHANVLPQQRVYQLQFSDFGKEDKWTRIGDNDHVPKSLARSSVV